MHQVQTQFAMLEKANEGETNFGATTLPSVPFRKCDWPSFNLETFLHNLDSQLDNVF